MMDDNAPKSYKCPTCGRESEVQENCCDNPMEVNPEASCSCGSGKAKADCCGQ